MMFKGCIAGGYTGRVQIKIFVLPDCQDCEETAEATLNHEMLHQVLDRVIGSEAKRKLDNVQKPFYVLDIETNKWQYMVEFVNKKSDGVIIIV
jgi:hypothetical protein